MKFERKKWSRDPSCNGPIDCVTALPNSTVQGGVRKTKTHLTKPPKASGTHGNMATLDDALCNVHQLATINIPDEQPQIEAPPASVTYISNFDTNFEDSKAFITCISKYLEEADVHKGLVGVLFIVDQTFLKKINKSALGEDEYMHTL